MSYAQLEVIIGWESMIYEENCYYHLYNRGCNKECIFRDSSDYRKLISIIQESEMSEYIELYAFAFMPNHYHFLVKQVSSKPVYKWIQYVFNRYGKYYNKRYERKGTLFESNVNGKLIDDISSLGNVVHYIHCNSVNKSIKECSSINYLQAKSVISLAFYEEYFGSLETYKKELSEYNNSEKYDVMESYLFNNI